MRPIILGTILALASFAHSQNGLPSCAQNCVNQFTSGSQIGSCGSLDIKCICSSSSFLSSIACCLASACNASDQAAAVLYAKQICTTAGVTVPDAVVCASSSTAAAPATSVAPSSVASLASSTADSSTGASVASSASTAPVSVTSSSAPAASSSASVSASATKNAGIQNVACAGMSFAGGLAAMLAFV